MAWQEVPVVTVFLLRRGPGGDSVLLLRRSRRVGTYRGRWAGVSGYLEGEPLAQAMKELAEETGLGDGDVELVRVGPPILAPDPRLKRRWIVHPFLMALRKGRKVCLDWEHVAARWVRPSSVFTYPTVPRLPEVLHSVYPLVPEKVWQLALAIAQDRRRGAGELAAAAIEAVAEVAQESPRALRPAACLLARARPGMPGIAMAIAHAYSGARFAADPAAAIRGFASRRQELIGRLISSASQVLPQGPILTYSRSSTVEAVLLSCRPPRVIVSEGRPLMEGVELARRLAQAGLEVELVTEAQLGEAIKEGVAVLVGADAVLPDGSIVNKVGTKALALLARERRIPFYVAVETAKVLSLTLVRSLFWEEGEPQEVASHLPDTVEVRNLYFDITPGRWISAYLTEHGLLDRRRLVSFVPAATRVWRALMGKADGLV